MNVTIKPLVWKEWCGRIVADVLAGSPFIEVYGFTGNGGGRWAVQLCMSDGEREYYWPGDYPSCEDAKRAAQEWHDNVIRSWIEGTP